VALTIAGSDSGGGAGIQADLRSFAFFEVFGTTAITAITAQNPREVTAVQAIGPDIVRRQIAAVRAAFTVGAAKTGMLFDAEIIGAVAAELGPRPPFPLVVDPVMVATSGARLLREDAVHALVSRLFPLAAVVTPNLPEAEILVGHAIRGVTGAMAAAAGLAQRFGTAILLKGGHLEGDRVYDILATPTQTVRLVSPRVSAPTTHGTGCSLSAAIAAGLARGSDLQPAVIAAKAYVHAALEACVAVGPGVWAMANPATLPVDAVRLEF